MDNQYQQLNMDDRNRMQQLLTQVAEELNIRLGKCLGFRTLAEVMAQHVKEYHAVIALQT